MRCGCPQCGAFMVHEESGEHLGCVCPDCLYRCTACLGTNSMISREEIAQMKSGVPNSRVTQLEQDFEQEEDLQIMTPQFDDPDKYYND